MRSSEPHRSHRDLSALRLVQCVRSETHISEQQNITCQYAPRPPKRLRALQRSSTAQLAGPSAAMPLGPTAVSAGYPTIINRDNQQNEVPISPIAVLAPPGASTTRSAPDDSHPSRNVDVSAVLEPLSPQADSQMRTVQVTSMPSFPEDDPSG